MGVIPPRHEATLTLRVHQKATVVALAAEDSRGRGGEGDSLLIDALPVFVEQTVIVHLRHVHVDNEDAKDLQQKTTFSCTTFPRVYATNNLTKASLIIYVLAGYPLRGNHQCV